MAELSEAFNVIKFETKNFQTIEHFFTQRNLKEEHEFLDQNMNRKNKQINIIYNFLAINIPQHNYILDDKISSIDIEIFGDSGYHYKGILNTIHGICPNFMIPLKGDKKLFVHIIYKESNNKKKNEQNFEEKDMNKKFVSFIEVPKRYQSVDNTLNKLKNDSEQSKEI
jgi:hypothetical protein